MSEEKTFREAYATLQKHAQTLRTQQEPDIDNLTTIVIESVEAYNICKQRIDAVEKALEQALGGAHIDDDSERSEQAPGAASSSSAASAASRRKGGSAEQDDDIPF